MLKAKRIMTKDVISVHRDTPLLDAMQLLVDKGISGLPVVDPENAIIGVISEKDCLTLLISDMITRKEVVGDHMSTDIKVFGPEDSIIAVCEFFMSNNFRRVPIVENGKLLGIISRRDIIRLILNSAAGKGYGAES